MLDKQICKDCGTVFENKVWIDVCPICRSKNFDRNLEKEDDEDCKKSTVYDSV